MNKPQGYSLIELLIFIVVIGIIATSIIFPLYTVIQGTPSLQRQNIANAAATKCAEYFLGERYLHGFHSTSLNCPNTTTPSYCTVPNGYIVKVNLRCTTINGDPDYKTVDINVEGKGNAHISLLLADY
jgi:prepilin-type N-terminal cleavage/methylation domain-containing protein